MATASTSMTLVCADTAVSPSLAQTGDSVAAAAAAALAVVLAAAAVMAVSARCGRVKQAARRVFAAFMAKRGVLACGALAVGFMCPGSIPVWPKK